MTVQGKEKINGYDSTLEVRMVTTQERIAKAISGIDGSARAKPRGKSVADVKPSLHQEVKPSLHYKYTSKNTHDLYQADITSRKTLVFDDKGLQHGFAQVPNAVLRDSRLSGNEKTLYALLLSYAWQNDECFPGQDLLSENMALSRVSISHLLASLKKHKLISWKRQGLGKVNIYHIRKLTDAYPRS